LHKLWRPVLDKVNRDITVYAKKEIGIISAADHHFQRKEKVECLSSTRNIGV
jgi:hypothetical protein